MLDPFKNSKPYFESPFHIDVKNGLTFNVHAEMME